MGDPQTSSDIFFGQDDADRIFNELKELQVDLDDDPLSHGPKRLNNKVSEVRRMLARCERLFLDVSQKLHFCRRKLKIESLNLELSKKHLLANDPVTRAGRSIVDREAIMAGILRKEIHAVHEFEMSEQDLESVLLVVKAKRSDLKDAEGRLRDQIRICQEEIGLGARWGSKGPKGSDIDLTPGIATPADLGAMNDLLANVEGEMHLAEAKGDWETPQEAPLSEEVSEESESEQVSLDEENGDVDLDKVLPPTNAPDVSDSFLKLDITSPPPAPVRKKEVKTLDDNVLEDLLGAFEEPGGA